MNNNQYSKIVIVGGSGFIGTRLAKCFEVNKINFEIIDKKISEKFPRFTKLVDVRNIDSLLKNLEGDVIINLAAEHRDDVTPRSLYDEVNVDGARRVCEVAEAKGINKIIFTSSVAVYGFAPIGTKESGEINYFNDYGRTKYEAELIYKEWQQKDPQNRSLVIVRPTVVFGEQNRGNVYNLFKQIASGKFIMIGKGTNAKSMAYVENVAAFLEHSLTFDPGIHIYNYVDKPDLNMLTLVKTVNRTLGKKAKIDFKLPYTIGYSIGKVFDLAAWLTGKKFTISSIRVKKFCANTAFGTSIEQTGFQRPVSLEQGIENTINYEFVDKVQGELFYSE
jgi:nucleoside-diphosphate-sugar epimerase